MRMRSDVQRWGSWHFLAVVSAFVLLFATFPNASGDPGVALAYCGFVAACVAVSYGFALKGATRGSVALCVLLAAVWAYAVGFVQYWSSCEWLVPVDWLVIVGATLYTQARLSGLGFSRRLAALTLPLLFVVLGSELVGALARGLTDDPKM